MHVCVCVYVRHLSYSHLLPSSRRSRAAGTTCSFKLKSMSSIQTRCREIRCVCVDTCMCVYVCGGCVPVVKALDCGAVVHRFKSHQPPLEENKCSLDLALHPGPNKTVNWGPGFRLGMDKTTGFAILHQGTGGTLGPTPWLEGISQCSCGYLAQLQKFVQHWTKSSPK